MSSAILYLAIIAIWLGVLVPRWLRRPAQVVVHTAEAYPAEMQTAGARTTGARATGARTTGARAAEAHAAEARVRGQATALWPDSDSDTEPIPRVSPEHDHLVSRRVPSPAAPRRMVLRARRRPLTMITALTAVALGMALTHVAAWWVVIPPAMMFGGFMVLLREAARTDAERARRLAVHGMRSPAARHDAEAGELAREAVSEGARDAMRETSREAARETAREVVRGPVAEPVPARTAEIIDISARLGDQLYDQYADAAVRAVGD